MSSKNKNSENLTFRNLTYQPFLLAVAIIAFIVKIIVSLTLRSPLLDWVLVIILFIFLAAIGVYVWEYRKPKRSSEEKVNIATGKIMNTEITGIDGKDEQSKRESVSIKTKDAEKSKITGIRRRKL